MSYAATKAAIGALWQEGRSLYEHSILAFDLETTGPDPETDLIVQLGAREILPGVGMAQSFGCLIYPGIPVPEDTARFHGITDEVLRDAPLFFELAGTIAPRFAAYDLILGYNAVRFDVPILERELRTAGFGGDLPPVLDPMPFVRWWWRDMRKANLTNVARRCGFNLRNAHDAVADVTATAHVFVSMVSRGLIPERVDAALAVQKLCADHHEAERAQYGGRFYDRGEGLRVGFGKWAGYLPSRVPPDYFRALLRRNDKGDGSTGWRNWPEASLEILRRFT